MYSCCLILLPLEDNAFSSMSFLLGHPDKHTDSKRNNGKELKSKRMPIWISLKDYKMERDKVGYASESLLM